MKYMNQDDVHITDKGQEVAIRVVAGQPTVRKDLEAEILAYLHHSGEASFGELGMNLKILAPELEAAVDQLVLDKLVYIVQFKPHPSTFGKGWKNTTSERRSVNVGDNVIVAAPHSNYFGKDGRVVAYKPSTPTSFASYVKVLMEDGTTRTFRPAEVRKYRPEEVLNQLEDTRDGQVPGDF